MYQMISTRDLIPHPENSNRMSSKFMKKLEENIRKSGNYETITVRPHPEFENKFQIINGHHRVEILNKLAIEEVKCDVWKVNDSEARLLIATLNRLEGQDVPELRMSLLKNLISDYEVSELESLIPESAMQLEEILELNKQDFEELQKQITETTSHFYSEMPDTRILDFFLNSEQYEVIIRALEQLIEHSGLRDRNEALYELARFYTHQNKT